MKHPVMLANMPDGRSIAGWSVFWCHMDTELFCRASCRFLVKFEMTDSLSLSLSPSCSVSHFHTRGITVHNSGGSMQQV